MNSNSHKIIQIKDTIKEIRYDIKAMEKKNDQKIKSFITSISPYQSQCHSHCSQSHSLCQSLSQSSQSVGTINDDATRELIKKYDSNYNEQYQPQPQPQPPHCFNNSSLTPSLCHYNNNFEPMNTYSYSSNDAEDDEAKLKQSLFELQQQNRILTQSLNEKRAENNALLQRKDNEDIYSTVRYLFEGNTIEDIMLKIEHIKQSNDSNSLRNELIEKMKSLYIVLTGTTEENEVDIKIIWRWIKHLIRTVKEMASGKEKTLQLLNDINDMFAYRDFCIQLIEENGLGSIAELKGFIKDLYAKANIGEKRIDKWKKVLFFSKYTICDIMALTYSSANEV